MDVKISDLIKYRPLALKCVAGGKGLSRAVTTSRVQKPGLLLTGLLEELHLDRVQILGAAEIGYIKSLDGRGLKRTLGVLKPCIPAIAMTRGLEPPASLRKFAGKNCVPLMTSPLSSSVFIERIIKFLEEKLAPSVVVHGVFVDVLGVGILIKGRSGIGKSECALELVSRGYRLVADDVVIVKRIYPSTLFGMGSDRIPYHLEVRGVGIVNIKDLFGITAIREKKQLDLVVELINWDPKGDYERLGFEQKTADILGVGLPYLMVPVSPGRSVAAIVEVAARNQLLKIMGYSTSRELIENLTAPKAVPVRKVKA
ncbi:MAG: HPr(Ser) kinase/phosphatase [Deltaproteobacteria bacterium]|nr:HPr(Ser) kinase/phosphatase [Deltaproteobacteria bacterium]